MGSRGHDAKLARYFPQIMNVMVTRSLASAEAARRLLLGGLVPLRTHDIEPMRLGPDFESRTLRRGTGRAGVDRN